MIWARCSVVSLFILTIMLERLPDGKGPVCVRAVGFGAFTGLRHVYTVRSWPPPERGDGTGGVSRVNGERERLARLLTPNRPVDVPEFFAGRRRLLDQATDAANTAGLHVVLWGDRGTGKTSLAKVLGHGAQEADRPEGRRVIFASCSSEDNYGSIWRKVFQEIQVSQRQLGFVQEATASVIWAAQSARASNRATQRCSPPWCDRCRTRQ